LKPTVKGYLEFWLPLVGVQEVKTLVVETTSWRGEDKGKESVEQGKKAARELAIHF
jgi:FMN-dependent NADH-azoreductase